MVLVQVELASNVQVRDVISFLLSRSYNNFRVTDQESLAPGYVPANVPGLSQSSSERFVQSPLMQDTDSAQNAFTRPESRHEKPLSDTTGISAPYQLDRISRHMAEEDTNENDLSLDVPSESRNVLMTENAQARSDEGSREVSSSSFNITWLRHVVRLLKKKGILKCSAKCAVCEMNIMVSPRSLISHINNRHTKYPL
uniref:C2H2-type domain-containing protein n=1 Tax=Angiostrongylus cantonensis TaxID=6313 RepID=A0A0K0DRK0_ANGCA